MSQTDFEDAEIVQSPPAGKDADGIPYCCKHHCRMRRASGGKKDTETVYYKCPVPKCDTRAQIIKVRRESIIPQNPVECPRCKESICERDEHNSNAQAVILKCPKCNWKSTAMATPQFANLRYDRQARAIPELGER